ncbi:MMPL family transporter [Pediococcus damnosus]|uniref:MMPL family transporter n=1 Tax=Pediococcus damnosus TaxID=51663 RepID=UPI003F6B8FBC
MTKTKKLKITSLISWAIILIGLIILLPNSLTWNNRYSQQLPADTSTSRQAPEATIVYTNPNGALSSKQKKAIQGSEEKLNANKKFLGVQAIESGNDSNAAHRLDSQDKSTELTVLRFKKNQNQFHILIPQIYSLVHTKGITTYVTGNDVLQVARAQVIQTATKIMIGICSVLFVVAIGIIFRSILAPLIALLLSGITYLASLSIATSAAHFLNSPYTAQTDLVLAIISFGIFPIVIAIFYRFYSNHFDDLQAVNDFYKTSWLPSLITVIPLIITGSALLLARNELLRSLWVVAVTLILGWLVFYTLMPALISFIDDLFFWPGSARKFSSSISFWHFNTTVGNKYPIITMVGIFIIIGSGLLIKSKPLNWSVAKDTPFSSQAKIGANVITSHYATGRVAPITISLTDKTAVTNTQDLAIINQLTQKLKSVSNVAAVYSVAQPAGTPLSNLYVNQQLQTITNQLAAANLNLTETQNSLKTSEKKLKNLKLSSTLKDLSASIKNLNAIGSQSSQVASQADNLTSDIATIEEQQVSIDNLLNSRSLTQGSKAMRQVLTSLKAHNRNLLSDLKTLHHNVKVVSSNNAVIAENISQVEEDQQTVSDDFKDANAAIQSTKTALTKDSKNVTIAQQNLATDRNYLNELSKSGIVSTLYMTGADLKTAPIKNALNQFNQAKNKTTTISIILNKNPSSTAGMATLKQLDTTTRSTLQGTSLAKSKVTYAGETVLVTNQKQAFKHDVTHLLPWLLGFLILYLFVMSRSLFAIYASVTLFAAYWLGYRLINLLSASLLKESMLADVPMVSGILFICVNLALIIPIILQTARSSTSQYLNAISSFDKVLGLIGILSLIPLLALGFTQLLSFIQIALVFLIAEIIWAFVFPLGISSALHITYDEI